MATIAEALQRAIDHHRAQRLNQAEQIYHQILQTEPNQPECLYGLGVLAQQLGQYVQAQQSLNTLIQVQPNSLKAWVSLGNLHQGQREWDRAINAYEKALAIAPDSVAAHNNLGYTWQQQGNWTEALASYKKALELDPNCIEAQVNWGNALHAQGQLTPEQQAHYAVLNSELGMARYQAGELKLAVAYYRQALLLKPDLESAHYHLAVALQAQREWQLARDSYEKVRQLNPSNKQVYFNLGQLYQGQKQLSEAASNYQQGLSLINPRYAAARREAQPPESVPPPRPEQVRVGGYEFPAIPPVSVPEEKRPFWSVVIPVYNRSDYLLECLASVLAQWSGHEEMEILVMDNASTSPLWELVQALGGGIVRYYRQLQNIGAQRNFNLGIALSRGQWIHLLNDDDYVLPGFYARLKQSLEGCSESVGAAFTGYENINARGEVIFSQQLYGEHKGIAQNFLQCIGVSNPLNMVAVVIRRAAYERLGGYYPELAYTPDWELYKRIAAFYDWWYEPEILARYRQHSNNITTELFLSGTQVTSIRQAIEISESYLPPEYCAEITSASRSYYFDYCLAQITIALKASNLAGAFRLLQETLKINHSAPAVAKLFDWLSTDEAALLRDEIVSKLILM